MNAVKNDFLGTGWKFPPSFNKTSGTCAMVSDEENIHNSLKILISTAPGERIMQPKYGCDLQDFLFEPVELSTVKRMTDRIEQCLILFEPRIRVLKIETEDLSFEHGKIDIHIHYEIKATNSRYNLVFPFYLEEGKIRP